MNKIIKSAILLLVFVGLYSCQDDETSTTTYVVPVWQQAPIDDDAIIEFLKSHYFNEEEFITPPTNFDYNIDFYADETITGVDENGDGDILDTNQEVGGHTRKLLFDYIGVDPLLNNGFTIEAKTDYVTIEGVDHTLYILKAVQGLGAEKPRFCDRALLSYEGITLDKEVFDNALNPIKLDLSTTVKGFSESVSEFNIATGVIDNGDGTFTYQDFGVGAVFMPSALGYYSGTVGSIPAYSPLIFKLKVYGTEELDHDADGVPTYVEDLNDDHDLSNDDTDLDGNENYIDVNDDNDPILTREEVTNVYVIYDGDADPALLTGEEEIDRVTDFTETPNKITITRRIYKDSDGDSIPDYLDPDS